MQWAETMNREPDMDAAPEPATRTTCPYCGVGCGVLAEPQPDGTMAVRGDPAHPANFGRLCSKGTALAETLDLEGRLLHPEIRGRRASWETALDAVAHGYARVLRDHGPQAVAFYVSGQLLTEDYYVANKLMKGFLGSANIDTNSRLCMASASPATCAPSAPMPYPATTRISTRPIWWCWSARTPPGATRCSTSA
jgi:assimilatory nitrate reductase catalytic subunit